MLNAEKAGHFLANKRSSFLQMRWGLGRDMTAVSQEEYMEKIIPFSIEMVLNG